MVRESDYSLTLHPPSPDSFQAISPLGRNMWRYNDPACEASTFTNLSVTISTCTLGSQFSCSSGQCIGIYGRCNGEVECEDESDEENCQTIHFPDSYDKEQVPELEKLERRANPIHTHVNILSIDFVDTVSMTVGLTIVLSLTWRERRVEFHNLLRQENFFEDAVEVTDEERKMLWLPMPNIIHENAILGNIEEDKRSYVNILPKKSAEEMTLEMSEESLVYLGSDNDLLMSKQFKLKFRCIFVLVFFPFDTQSCQFFIVMNIKGNTSIALDNSMASIQYDGPFKLNEFEVQQICVCYFLTFVPFQVTSLQTRTDNSEKLKTRFSQFTINTITSKSSKERQIHHS